LGGVLTHLLHQIDQVGGRLAKRARGEPGSDLPERIALVADDRQKLEDVPIVERSSDSSAALPVGDAATNTSQPRSSAWVARERFAEQATNAPSPWSRNPRRERAREASSSSSSSFALSASQVAHVERLRLAL